MAMRGAEKKTHNEPLGLRLLENKLPMQGAIQTLRKTCGDREDWVGWRRPPTDGLIIEAATHLGDTSQGVEDTIQLTEEERYTFACGIRPCAVILCENKVCYLWI